MSSWVTNLAAVILVLLIPCSLGAEQQSQPDPLPISEIAPGKERLAGEGGDDAHGDEAGEAA